MPITFDMNYVPEYSVTRKQIILYSYIGVIDIYYFDINEWRRIRIDLLNDSIAKPILSSGAYIFIGEYVVIYSVHHMFYISVTRNRKQCYPCFTDRCWNLQFYAVITKDYSNSTIINDSSIISNESYRKLDITHVKLMFEMNPSVIFITGKIHDTSRQWFITCVTTTEMFCKSNYYIYNLTIKDVGKFVSFPDKITRGFKFINPADLRGQKK